MLLIRVLNMIFRQAGTSLFFAIAIITPLLCASEKQPNIVVIVADDLRVKELGCYGGKNVPTPHIDNLAHEGMRFTSAFASEAMCATVRSALYTGLFPIRNGCFQNHGTVKNGTISVVQRLRACGYRVGLTGKLHVKPQASFPFEIIPGFESASGSTKAAYSLDGINAFMTANSQQPFCLFICSIHPHRPWTSGDASHFPPSTLILPPLWVDNRETREAFSHYCAEVEELDHQVRDISHAITGAGLRDNTIFMFAGEQGAQFPGAKWTLWDEGVHTGLIVRWPGHVSAGSTTDALVQYEDILPTFIEVAGGAQDKELDGSSFAHVLTGKTTTHRTYVYGVHNNVPEGNPYPIRSIFDGRYRLIINLLPQSTYHERHLMDLDNVNYWKSWLATAATDPTAKSYVDRYLHRPAVELYDTTTDRTGIDNVAGTVALAAVQARLTSALYAWMEQQGDVGAAMDVAQEANTRKK